MSEPDVLVGYIQPAAPLQANIEPPAELSGGPFIPPAAKTMMQLAEYFNVPTVGIPGVAGISATPPPVTEIDNDYYATFGIDNFILVDCSERDVTVYLPLALTANSGLSVRVARAKDNGTFNLNVCTRNGQQFIDTGNSTWDMPYPLDMFGFESNGSAYKVF